MNDNRHTCRLHVRSADSSVAEFSVPQGLNNVQQVRLVEAEINNALTTTRQDNDTIYFNEFEIEAEYDLSGASTADTIEAFDFQSHGVKSTHTVTMFAAQMPRLMSDVDSTVTSAQTAMNTPRAIYKSDGTSLANVMPQNAYVVRRVGGGGKTLKVFISPIQMTGSYNQDQTQPDNHPSSVTPFAVRVNNTPTVAITRTAVWNPYDVDVGAATAKDTNSYRQALHCSPFRIIMPLQAHSFIPGDPVTLDFDVLTESTYFKNSDTPGYGHTCLLYTSPSPRD